MGGAAYSSALVAATRWLYRAGGTRPGVRAGRDGPQYTARFHRRVEFRPRRVFWSRRLWRRAHAALPGAFDAGGDRGGHAARRLGWYFIRPLDRATTRRLFRDVYDRFRTALVLSRL